MCHAFAQNVVGEYCSGGKSIHKTDSLQMVAISPLIIVLSK